MGEHVAIDIPQSSYGSFNSSTQHLLGSSKVHPGYGASRLPVTPARGVGLVAGQPYFNIFGGHIGRAVSAPDTSLGWPIVRRGQPRAPEPPQPESHPDWRSGHSSFPRKPDHLKWNAQTRKLYPLHWLQVKQIKQAQEKAAKEKEGLTLPFSRNIGPGNSIQPAISGADLVAQNHDLLYQNAKEHSEVLSADREAIREFVHEAIQSTDPVSQLQATIGAVGLGIKHLAETVVGPLYGKYATSTPPWT